MFPHQNSQVDPAEDLQYAINDEIRRTDHLDLMTQAGGEGVVIDSKVEAGIDSKAEAVIDSKAEAVIDSKAEAGIDSKVEVTLMKDPLLHHLLLTKTINGGELLLHLDHKKSLDQYLKQTKMIDGGELLLPLDNRKNLDQYLKQTKMTDGEEARLLLLLHELMLPINKINGVVARRNNVQFLLMVDRNSI